MLTCPGLHGGPGQSQDLGLILHLVADDVRKDSGVLSLGTMFTPLHQAISLTGLKREMIMGVIGGEHNFYIFRRKGL